MEDLSQQLNQILSDPKSMEQVQSVLSSLGLAGSAPASSTPQAPSEPPKTGGGIDPSALAGVLNALGGGAAPSQPAPAPLGAPNGGGAGGISPEMLGMVTKLAPLLGQVNREDDSTRLLRALRPLLSPGRQKKVDEAVKILQMMRLLPLLKESGVFSGLLSGLL